ncbi:SPFH domain-containing protein [Escherichia phage VEc25]|uniref:Serine protease n=4 Tax=Enquatrovirus N4 TaxID=10752 RepID=A0A3G3MCH9_9CAUD|nr:putative SPFH domain protein [Escherichia phage PMBT57]AYR04203.1 serine protease [Escherichia phage OLB145]QDF14918.1 hypothetical protein AC3HA13_200 [Escherichia phage vB_EcoP_3HA13]QPN96286.1 SPFH domain-containing protein [Escherichia phage VEc25]QXV75829.1 hypothetical protein bas69_0061 [Escherichia phage AlfredRasser]CAE6410766.1 gp20 [Escherichia phage vB_Eco_Jura]
MYKYIAVAIAGLIIALSLTSCYDRVEPGNVGIIVNRLGEDKGVENEVKGVGRYWLTWNEELYTFPTFKQMKTYDGLFYFQLSDGTQIGHQMAISYKVNPTKVTNIFQTYRKGVNEITEQDLRQRIADVLNRQGNLINTDTFIDGGKSKLLDSVTDTIRKEMEPVGIDIIAISWIGAPEYPDNVKRAINAKVEATQKTLQREQEIQQRVAEANMEREQAKGVADAILIKAKAEADAIRLRGEALTENPNVMQLEAINKWNGTLPTTMIPGATTPFVNVK